MQEHNKKVPMRKEPPKNSKSPEYTGLLLF